ncbi:DEAD/DEAH box helicase [Kaarinaea lacus]
MSFQSLGLQTEILRAVSEKGYTDPTPIQQQAIPLILQGNDIMGGAQTGTGKTAGFVLPLLQLLMNERDPAAKRKHVQVLVLAPTRELAAQVQESVKTYGKYLPISSAAVFGGVNINPQKQKLRKGVEVLVATPGRLLDHVSQNTVNLSAVKHLVLDEADRMLDMGFIHDIRKIISKLPKKKQTLFFSATFSGEIKRLANELLRSPKLVEVAQHNKAADNVTQIIHPVDKSRKRELLSYLIGSQNWKQVLVFNRTKHGANRLSEQLNQDGISSTAIHGNKSQGARSKALADFKSGKVRVLVATDVAARGLDIEYLPQVVNFDLPDVAEDYVHRIGRTGRAGREGSAMSLVCVDELKLLKGIERLMKRDIPKLMIEDFEPDPSIKPQPIRNGGFGQSRNSGKTSKAGRSANSSKGTKKFSGKQRSKGKTPIHSFRGNQSKRGSAPVQARGG